MTNWATLSSAALALTAHQSQCHRWVRCTSSPLDHMFKRGFDKYQVIDLCHPKHTDITQNQSRRWVDNLQEIAASRFFKRPSYTPSHTHELYYHEPIWEKLQSSYADVEGALNIMRVHPKHKHCLFMLVGCDAGLAVHRINHTITRLARICLQTAPAII
eukprot:1755821-Pleurochrysis_carterae.AAC.1